MNEKQRLIDALKEGATTDWARVALSAVEDREVVFAGNPGCRASTMAGDLLPIYRIRLKHGIEAHGLAELVESLACRGKEVVIEGQPFLGPKSAVSAFWDAAGNLIACVTILGRDPEDGQRNLDLALGKR
jgi:hypothetical protein